jgi:quercetin dioxygenase-like cupin family protein
VDALSHLLDDVHFRGAEYVYLNGLQNWAFTSAKQTIFYIILTGEVGIDISQEQRTLSAGHIIFVPYGAKHRFYDKLHLQVLMTSIELNSEFRGARYDPVTLGQGNSQVLMLAVRCLLDSEMAKPLLSSLPDYILIEDGLNGEGPAWLKIGLDFLALESERIRVGRDTLINRLISMFFIECVRDYVEQLPSQSDTWLHAVRDPYLAPCVECYSCESCSGLDGRRFS